MTQTHSLFQLTTQVMRPIWQLGKQDIVKEVSRTKRDRVYSAKKLLDILEESAQLKTAAKF